jgi:hypothetical protein
MRTEITDIKKWIGMYTNPKNWQEFDVAQRELKKVHNKYGTIDISIIKQLTQ